MRIEDWLFVGVFALTTLTIMKGDNMKVIVAGSRDIDDYVLVSLAIKESNFKPTMIVSGGAQGVDHLGEVWARQHKIPIISFIPNWEKFGRAAGPKRNLQMAEFADALVAVWDGKSRGTASMIRHAKKIGLNVHVKMIP